MANIKIFSKLLGNINNFKKFIVKSISEQLNKKLFSKTNTMKSFIKNTILESIKSQPEYSDLKYGSLRNIFGIENISDIDAILDELEKMEVDIKKPTAEITEIRARISISMIKDGFSDMLSSSAASYTSEKGFPVPWLEWLLTRGNDSVIIGYRYLPKTSPSSRTGYGIMIKGDSAIFRVPPEFAGTIENNWITRGVDEALPKIESHLNKMVENAL